MSEELWGYDEPHESGGNSHVTMTRSQAIALMHEVYPGVYEGRDDDAFEQWVVVHWADREAEWESAEVKRLTESIADLTQERDEAVYHWTTLTTVNGQLRAEIEQLKIWNGELKAQASSALLHYAAARGREDGLKAQVAVLEAKLARLRITLSPRDAEQLIHDIEHPAPANEELRKAFEAYKEVIETEAGDA